VRYVWGQILFFVAALWLAATFTFFLPQLLGLPGSGPLLPDYFSYLQHLSHFDLGVTHDYVPESVNAVIGGALPWTLLLVGSATAISFVLGTLLGVILAWYRGFVADTLVVPGIILLNGLPYFFAGMLLLYVFGIALSWFPYSGSFDPAMNQGWSLPFVVGVIYHTMLPALSILVSTLGLWLLPMRNSMLSTLHEEYIVLAQAKGLRRHQVMLGYAARNAILPPLTGLAVQLGFVVTGNIVVETIFNYPGIGLLLVHAVGEHNYPVIQGIILVSAAATLLANLLANLLYAWLDPRVRQS
jgi:peptide/nickel transport system permease protein